MTHQILVPAECRIDDYEVLRRRRRARLLVTDESGDKEMLIYDLQ